jgi:hypothetical protein
VDAADAGISVGAAAVAFAAGAAGAGPAPSFAPQPLQNLLPGGLI